MLDKAQAIKARSGKSNAQFIRCSITDIPLEDETADCIISNCVINLVPHEEKHRVFKEIVRLLKPGGRLAGSDILAKKPLSESIRNSMALYVGCVAGASQVHEYEAFLADAGFSGELACSLPCVMAVTDCK